MKKYYLQVYKRATVPLFRREWVMIEDLPYQTLIMERLSALGVIDIEDNKLPVDQIERVAKILRLRQSLEVNLSGAVIICDLLDRLETLENELDRQKRL